MSVARVLAGVEYQPIQGLVARVGTSIDTAGATTFSAGLGYYPSNHVFFDVAYAVYNVYPELRHEFGSFQLFSVALTLVY